MSDLGSALPNYMLQKLSYICVTFFFLIDLSL